jgi:stress-induced morphogen
MTPEEVEDRIEAEIPGAEATVTRPRGADDEDHLAATVVSPAFAGETVLDRHEMVRAAVEDALTDSLHALEITTRTPDED